MAREIIHAPNVVQFLRPRIRIPTLADALVNVSTARAMLAPLNDASASARFDRESARALIWEAAVELGKAIGNINRSYEHG